MSNCCPVDVVNGGSFLSPEILTPIIHGAVLNSGVTIDSVTAQKLVEQLCPVLDSCIVTILSRNELSNLELRDTGLSGTTSIEGIVRLSEYTAKSFVDGIMSSLEPELLKYINKTNFSSVTADTTTTKNLEVSHSIKLSDTAIDSFKSGFITRATDNIVKAIEGAKLGELEMFTSETDVTVVKQRLEVRGDVDISSKAYGTMAAKIYDLIKPSMDTWFDNKTITPERTKSVAATNGTATNLTVNEGAISKVELSSVNMKNSQVKDSTLEGSVIRGGTTLSGSVALDDTAKQSFCDALCSCLNEMIPTAESFVSMLRDCAGIPLAVGQRVTTCIDLNAALENFRATLPLMDLVTNMLYDGNTHEIVLTTVNSDGTTNEIRMSADAFGGQVFTDDDTIIGSGISSDPLRVRLNKISIPLETTTVSQLPLKMVGSRDGVMGLPVGYIQLGPYLLPYYKAM